MPIAGRRTAELCCCVEHAAGATLLEVVTAASFGRRRGNALRVVEV